MSNPLRVDLNWSLDCGGMDAAERRDLLLFLSPVLGLEGSFNVAQLLEGLLLTLFASIRRLGLC